MPLLNESELHDESISSVDMEYANGAGHSLPNVEEYKVQAAHSGPRPPSKISQKRRARLFLLIASFIVIAVIIIAVSVAVSNNNKNQATTGSTDSNQQDSSYYDDMPIPTGVATKQPGEDRKKGVIELITFMEWSNSDDLNTPGRPQYKACVWLADEDPMQMEISDTLEFRQRYALAVFYFALKQDNQSWYANKALPWFTADPVCSWTTNFATQEGGTVDMGVLCYGGNVVKELYLPNSGASGSIPNEITLLYDLEGLWLDQNEITSPLNAKLTELRNLKDLSLAANKLSGHWPLILSMMKLRTLNLAKNSMTGSVPNANMWAETIENLILTSNDFEVDIKTFANLPNIKNLNLGDNRVKGNLTSEILSSWPSIEVLDLSSNALGGSLPDNLFTMESLRILDLQVNVFTGVLPTDVNENADLRLLSLYDNRLTGPMDIVTEQLTNLQHLDLSNNGFSGGMPSFSKMDELRYLFLSFNTNLEGGPIPLTIANLPLLIDVSLQSTRRTGTIHTEFGNLKRLVMLDLGFNELEGTIPTQLGSASSMAFLMVNHNSLTGTIPDSVGKLSFLRSLIVDKNKLSGPPGAVCESKPLMLDNFIADCDEIECPASCCTLCCEDGDENTSTECNDRTWNGNIDPVYDLQYKRESYQIYKGQPIYPVDMSDNSASGGGDSAYYYGNPNEDGSDSSGGGGGDGSSSKNVTGALWWLGNGHRA